MSDLDFLGTREQPTFGVDTFGDVALRADGTPTPYPEAIREVVAEAIVCEQHGLDYFGIGEHHRPDFAVSAPDMVLAAIAGQTQRIRLGTGVTVLSSDDPVRVFERFATLDAVSSGRAEITVGRGSFTESFQLFGYSLTDYDILFEERLQLLAEVLTEGPVTWQGNTRAALHDQQIYPKTQRGRIPTWVGVGGTPESVVRAAAYGFPLVLAVIGGSPARFAPLVELYHRALAEVDRPEQPVAMHSPGHVAATDEQAREEHFLPQRDSFARIGRERGWGEPMSRQEYDAHCGPTGAYFVGSPETVAQKVAWAIRTLGLSRFNLKYAVGNLPHEKRLESLRLYGSEVVPRVREILTTGAQGPR
ncbi:MAG TPA: LLM class flavin-dependent oxidoreductase [Marmoricola sp.]|nr:LLM class flavin-dependent oxidoreductase [Marmoricola sp.]